jgi:hypothetical protein
MWLGAGSWELGAGSAEPGAGSWEPGARFFDYQGEGGTPLPPGGVASRSFCGMF